MKSSEVIAILQRHMQESGTDPEVLAQSAGCCNHGHEIKAIEMGRDGYNSTSSGWTKNEIGSIIIRV